MTEKKEKRKPEDLTMGAIHEKSQVRKKRLPDGTFMLLDERESEFDEGKLKAEKATRDLRAK